MRFYELEQESVITIDDVSIKEMNIEWLRNSVSLLKVSGKQAISGLDWNSPTRTDCIRNDCRGKPQDGKTRCNNS